MVPLLRLLQVQKVQHHLRHRLRVALMPNFAAVRVAFLAYRLVGSEALLSSVADAALLVVCVPSPSSAIRPVSVAVARAVAGCGIDLERLHLVGRGLYGTGNTSPNTADHTKYNRSVHCNRTNRRPARILVHGVAVAAPAAVVGPAQQ